MTLPPTLSSSVDGRLLVIVSRLDEGEPRTQVTDGPTGQPVFGIDVENWAGPQPQAIDGAVRGFPIDSISDLPAGTYTVQALVHRYETFKRGDGHTVKMPMDRGEGQQWSQAPGNLYSTPKKVALDPAEIKRSEFSTRPLPALTAYDQLLSLSAQSFVKEVAQ